MIRNRQASSGSAWQRESSGVTHAGSSTTAATPLPQEWATASSREADLAHLHLHRQHVVNEICPPVFVTFQGLSPALGVGGAGQERVLARRGGVPGVFPESACVFYLLAGQVRWRAGVHAAGRERRI